MRDWTKGPGAIAAFLGVGLVSALAVAKWGNPFVAVGIGVIAVALAIRASMGDRESPGSDASAPGPHVDPLAAETFAPVIGAASFGGVFVEVGASELMLCLFPVSDPKGLEELAKAKAPPGGLAALVVFNDGAGDHLFGERVMDAFGVARERVYATDPTRKLSRANGEDDGRRQARRLPDRLEVGDCTLVREAGHVRARWSMRYGGCSALIGCAVPHSRLMSPPHVQYVIGSVWIDDAIGAQPSTAIDAFLELRSVVLIEGEAAGIASRVARYFSTMGVRAIVAGARDAEEVVEEAIAAAREGGEAFDRLAERAPVELWIDVVTELAVLGEHALADARLEALIAREPNHRLLFELGISKLMQRELEPARAAFARAASSGSDIAWNSLASVLAELGRLDEAIGAVKEGCARMPHDPITHETAFALFLRAGDRASAAAIADQALFSDVDRDRLRAQLDAPPERRVQRFTGHAEIALGRGTKLLDAGELERAATMLRRAVALDPLHLEAHVELAFVLGKLEDDDALRALCERAIEEIPGGELLRFNLGNLAIRSQRWDEARVAFEALLERAPAHRDARVNLVSALCALGRKAEARGHVDRLESDGLAADLVAQLRAQCA